MDYEPTIIAITSLGQAKLALEEIQADPAGVGIMAPKAVFKVIKLEGVPAKEANLLKQTFLAKGGEVAVARGTADLSVAVTDVLICGTLKHYRQALAQLKHQPWGLPSIAVAIETALTEHLNG